MRVRVVVDANIYVSALMKTEGLPSQALRTIIEERNFELVLSEAILEELKRILFYKKIRTRIKRTDQELLSWLDALCLIAHLAMPRHSYPPLVLEDPDDDVYLIAALETHASFLISGDQHLLKMKKFENIQIVTAAEFLALI